MLDLVIEKETKDALVQEIKKLRKKVSRLRKQVVKLANKPTVVGIPMPYPQPYVVPVAPLPTYPRWQPTWCDGVTAPSLSVGYSSNTLTRN